MHRLNIHRYLNAYNKVMSLQHFAAGFFCKNGYSEMKLTAFRFQIGHAGIYQYDFLHNGR